MRVFFYGTMMDPDVRRLVLGDRAAELEIRPALLPGFRRVAAARGDYPMLLRRAASRVGGQLADGLGQADLQRLMHFEGPDYLPSREAVIGPSGERRWACVLLPRSGVRASRRAWDYRRWQLRRKSRLLPQIRAWMRESDRFGGYSVEITWPARQRLRHWPETD